MIERTKQYKNDRYHFKVRINKSNANGGLKITFPLAIARRLNFSVGDTLDMYIVGEHIELYHEILDIEGYKKLLEN